MIKDVRSQLNVLISNDKIQERIKELAQNIYDDYHGKPLTLVSILRGSIFFTVDLSRKLDLIFDMEFVELSSYGNDFESSGNIKINKDLTNPVENRHLLIIEDIIDTGHSLKFITEHLKKYNPLSIATCVLLDKASKRVADITPNYVGFVIPDKFIIGYGLDYYGHFRNVNYIGYLGE